MAWMRQTESLHDWKRINACQEKGNTQSHDVMTSQLPLWGHTEMRKRGWVGQEHKKGSTAMHCG